MKVKDLIPMLNEYIIDDHGRESEIRFYDTERGCYLELMPQDDYDPGIEHEHYMGCRCVSGFTINLKKEK